MAFSYRNTLDSALSALPQRYSDQILADLGDKIDYKLKNLQKLFSYRVTSEVQELLANVGMELAPISYQNHSHPACKMIENHILYVSLPNLLQNEFAIGLMSLREQKRKTFIKMRRFLKFGEFSATKMFNACIDAKDLFRYGNEAHIGDFSSRVRKIAREFAEPGFNARVMLVHDELHFHSPENILEIFEEVKELRAIVGTVVCPVELLVGDSTSKNPRLYGFDIKKGNLHFFPDGNPSEGYIQPVETTTWYLKTSSISRGSMRLRITVIQSIYAHHLVVIDRVGKSLKKGGFYAKPPCLLNQELMMLDRSFKDVQIERQTMSSILTYLACLKSPNAESAIAKLRQLEKRQLFVDEMFLVSTISQSFSTSKFGKGGLNLSLIEGVKDSICQKLPWLMSFFASDRVWQNLYRVFLKEMSTKWFEVEMLDLTFDDLSSKNFQCVNLELPTSELNVGVSERVVIPKAFFESKTSEASSSYNPEMTPPMEPTMLRICDSVYMSTEDHGSRNQVVLCKAEQSASDGRKMFNHGGRRNDCVLRSIAPQIDMTSEELMELIGAMDISDDLLKALMNDKPLNLSMISEISNLIGRTLVIDYDGKELCMGLGSQIFLKLADGHCTVGERHLSDILKPKLPSIGVVNYAVQADKAMRLLKSLIRGTTGVLFASSEELKAELGSLTKALGLSKEFDVQVGYTWGAPGSGKTHGLIQRLKGDDSIKACVISPRRLLADDWVDSLLGSNSKVFTFELALSEDLRMYNAFIFDEITLYPPGYMDLFMYKILISRMRKMEVDSCKKSVSVEKIFSIFRSITIHVIGDPMQSRYYSESDEIILSRKHDVDTLVENGACKILWRSFRMGAWFEELIDIPCINLSGQCNSKLEKFHFFSGLSSIKGKFDVILCASRDDKRNLAGHIPVMTFGESQGLTFNKALIAITDSTHKVSDHHLFVGLTRSREQFHFIVTSERTLSENLKVFDRKLLGYVLRQEKISKERLASLFSNCKKAEFVSEDVFGSALSDKLESDIFLRPFADLSEDVDIPCEDLIEEVVVEPSMKCHLPVCKVNPLHIDVFEKMKAKEFRELHSLTMGSTEQFRDLDTGFCSFEMNAAMSFQAIFPKHTSTDSATFAMGVKKRLRFSNPRDELNELRRKSDVGERMADFFLKNLPKEFRVSQQDVQKGQLEFNQKRASKPAVLFESHSGRSEIDWPLDWVFIFMKSQLCTKSEKMYCDAKAGQTLACFHHLILFKFGPVLRAIESAFERAVGDKFYVHSRKDFGALNEYVLQNKGAFIGLSTESDYEAFDSSQDATILAFEVALLRRLGVSRDFIRDYITLKTTLGSKLGNFAVMRFTGEFCTFLFNTFANMLFTFLKYDINDKTRMLFAGDDMASIGVIKERHSGEEKMLKGLRLKAKEDKRHFPMFCGWFLTPDGIYKKPSLLWARLMVMKERGEIKQCIDNYLLEMAWAYKMGEGLYKYLDESEMECHYKCVRFFIEKSSMCRGEALKVIKTFGSVFGGTECRSASEDYLNVLFKRVIIGGISCPGLKEKLGIGKPSYTFEPCGKFSTMVKSLSLHSMEVAKKEDQRILILKENQAAQHKRLREFRLIHAFEKCSRSLAKHEAKAEIQDRGIHEHSLFQMGKDLVSKFGGPLLGQVAKMLETNGERCQLSELMTSCCVQKQKSCELMQLTLGRFTKMQTFFPEKFSTVLEGLNPISRCTEIRMKLAFQDFQSLMKMKSDGFRENLGNTTTFISELFYSGSHHCFQMQKKQLELSQLLIQLCSEKSKGILHLSKSTLRRGQLSFQSGLGIVSQSLIHIFRMLLRFLCSFQVLKLGQVESWSGLTLGLCTGWPIQRDFYQAGSGMMGMQLRKFRVQKEYLLDLVYNQKICTSWSKLGSHVREGVEAYSYLKEFLEVESIRRAWRKKEKVMEQELEGLKSQTWGSLGHPRLDMKEVGLRLLTNMSLQEIVRAGIRSRVKRFLWSNFIDPNHVLIAVANLPAFPAEPTGAHLEIYERVLNYYLPILFGNMALLGVSGKVIWPSVAIPIPNIHFEAGGEVVNWETELNLFEVCPALEGWRNTSDFQPLRSGTLRNLAEPFAVEAMKFLKERRQFNVYTNIYIKLPRAFEMAPWVAFDFASGLDLNILNNDEKTVMERMNTRIFRTEGQKVAFRAQGEANLSLEG